MPDEWEEGQPVAGSPEENDLSNQFADLPLEEQVIALHPELDPPLLHLSEQLGSPSHRRPTEPGCRLFGGRDP